MKEFLRLGGKVFLLTNVFFTFNFLGNLVLVRLLSPQMFGSVALALSLVGLVEIGTTFSLNTVYVQRRSSSSLLATVFQFLGAVVVLKIVVAASIYLIFRNQYEQHIWTLFAIIFVSKLVVPFSSLLISVMEKELMFARASVIVNMSNTLGVVLAILAASAGAGMYSLLFREALPLFFCLAGAVYFSRHLTIRWRRLNKRQMKLVARASVEMFGQRAAELSYARLPFLFVEASFGVEVLGILKQALYLVNFVNRATNVVNQQMGMVYFNRFRKDARKTREGWMIMATLSTALGLPVAIALYLLPAQIVTLLWGRDWLAAVPVLQNLAAAAILLPLYTIMKSQLYGMRKNNAVTLGCLAGTIVYIALLMLPYATVAGAGFVAGAATISYVVMIAVSYPGLATLRPTEGGPLRRARA